MAAPAASLPDPWAPGARPHLRAGSRVRPPAGVREAGTLQDMRGLLQETEARGEAEDTRWTPPLASGVTRGRAPAARGDAAHSPAGAERGLNASPPWGQGLDVR